MSVSLRLSWQDEVVLTSTDDEAIIRGPRARIVCRPLNPELFAALKRLAPPGEDEEQLAEFVLNSGTVESLARWYFHLDQLQQRGMIRRTLHADGTPLATWLPLGQTPQKTGGSTDSNAKRNKNNEKKNTAHSMTFVLSRFAYIRRLDSDLVLESPLAHSRILLHHPRIMSLLAVLSKPQSFATLPDLSAASGLGSEDIKGFLTLLRLSNMLEAAPHDDPSQNNDNGRETSLETWEFHDLLFHSRSRRGRSDGQFGGTYRLSHRPAPPALKPRHCPETIPLFRPDLEQLQRSDPPLAAVQERRHSVREYGDRPLSVQQLGEFLYRVGRVREMRQMPAAPSSGPPDLELALRPYPSGGALYELEFYVAVRSCEGLPPGLYDYDPANHCLGFVEHAVEGAGLLLDEAAASAGMAPQSLQTLIILSSRFDRIAWKYESIAYSLTLKHVGVLYQTMYLAATAMGLAPCALGCGDSDLFARVAGTDYYVETSVGEFLLGSTIEEVQNQE